MTYLVSSETLNLNSINHPRTNRAQRRIASLIDASDERRYHCAKPPASPVSGSTEVTAVQTSSRHLSLLGSKLQQQTRHVTNEGNAASVPHKMDPCAVSE